MEVSSSEEVVVARLLVEAAGVLAMELLDEAEVTVVTVVEVAAEVSLSVSLAEVSEEVEGAGVEVTALEGAPLPSTSNRSEKLRPSSLSLSELSTMRKA